MTGLRAAVDVWPSAQRWMATLPWVRWCPTSTFLVVAGRRFWIVARTRSVSLLSLFSEVYGSGSVLVSVSAVGPTSSSGPSMGSAPPGVL
ncbi:MAG: hypothetical protein K0U70_14675 [Actinomycetia bacterium]|nr:hypothetical protein [Actinomycetes bacterium]MCH9710380.1 hypothetical protein [Actinomycetes bacterium]MCH9769035.1 hypothetical protein [Actinomycetes bacterium]